MSHLWAYGIRDEGEAGGLRGQEVLIYYTGIILLLLIFFGCVRGDYRG